MKPILIFLLPLTLLVVATFQPCGSQWAFRPIIVSHDILPHTNDSATPKGMQGVRIIGDTVYFKDEHGIFFATPDTLVALVTELDTIPGTHDLFESFDDYGGLPKPGMWTTALGYTGSTSLTARDLLRPGIGAMATFGDEKRPVWGGVVQWLLEGGSVGGFTVIAAGKIGFTYAIGGRLTFFVAQPGRVSCLGGLPDTYRVNETEYNLAAGDGLGPWLMEDTPAGTVVYFVWNVYVRGFIGDDLYSGFFSFDGKTVNRMLARGDHLGVGDSVRISSISGRFLGPLIARDREGDRWMVQAGYSLRRKTGEWKSADGILLVDHGRVVSIVQAGDSIARSGGALPSDLDLYKRDYSGNPVYSLFWQPDFSRRAAVLFADFLNPAIVLAHDGIVEPISPWGKGSELPGIEGGRVGGYSVAREGGGLSALRFTRHLVSLENLWATSLVTITGSKADVTQGIFRSEGSTVRPLIMQGDSIAKGGARRVFGLESYDYLGSHDVLVYIADVEESGSAQALLCLEGGRSTEIITTAGGGVIDKRRPGRGRAVNFSSLGLFKVIAHNKIVLFGGNPVVSGWFLAERPQ